MLFQSLLARESRLSAVCPLVVLKLDVLLLSFPTHVRRSGVSVSCLSDNISE